MSNPTRLAALRSFGLYRRLVAARLRSQWQYRTSFFLNLGATFAITFVDFLVVLVLFRHIPSLRGWTVEEVAFLYGLSGIGFAVADMVVGHIEETHVLIRSGQFDVLLVRPAGTLLQVVAGDLALRRLGKALQAGAVLAYAVAALDLAWTPDRFVLAAVAVAAGAVIFASVWILGACIVFWTVEGSEFSNAFTYGGSLLTSYPLNVFGPWLRRLLAYALPLAFVTYFPGLYLLDRPDPLGLPRVMQFLSPAVAALLFALATSLWRVAVRHYRSTGS